MKKNLMVILSTFLFFSPSYYNLMALVMGPPPTVAFVDLERYQGLWHELARLPAWFQRDCLSSNAKYSLNKNGTVKVVNSCFSKKKNKWRSVEGTARSINSASNSQLKVLFPNFLTLILPNSWFEGDYWVLALDDDYQIVLVGDPTYQYMWILARDFSPLKNGKLEQYVQIAKNLGYPVEKLIYQHLSN